MKKAFFVGFLLMSFLQQGLAQPLQQPSNDRATWLLYLDKLAAPVLSALARDKLKETMPLVLSVRVDNKEARTRAAYLEAFARVMTGIAPWLNAEGGSAEEMALRAKYRGWAISAIDNASNPAAKDYMSWTGGQPLVDASFLALALVRCPWLWTHLEKRVQQQLVNAFTLTREIVPGYNNWILFSGMIEAFFCKYQLPYDALRIEYGIREFATHWYVGDGLFSDGQQYHWDYYNSYVIQPFLANILATLVNTPHPYDWFAPRLQKITQRYAVLLERMINTDGSFPVTGRSIVYRGAAFHHLADMALRKQLPPSLPAGQVRAALSAVLQKTLAPPATFTKDGWLQIGLYGNQPGLADSYINTGSLYLCSTILLPLGLPANDEFWTAPSLPWTSVKVWSGQDMPADHALELP
ncbi:MAG TPA: DUF2264 domain-containing protein [Chitinophagaceae bacterium]|nr:DUF2264 domain-containing protein [Chitinophagaceae bacterium]